MPKFKVCVTKIIKLFDHLEVEAPNDLEAKRVALSIIEKMDKDEFLALFNESKSVASPTKWTERERPTYKAEVV